jgi:poly(hydroxyalkanoate) granule-associated protein
MVKKLQKTSASKKTNAPLSGSVKDSAQQIWQAGLGAFSRAQAEGSKAFDLLVKEGVSLQRKTQSAAEERLSDATHKMSSMASDISNKATGQWDKLESIFEERVAKALNKLGVPSSKDVAALIERIEDLNKSVQKLSRKPATKTPSKKTVNTPVKTAAKPAAKKSSRAPAKAAAKTPTRAATKPATKRTRARKTAPATVASASENAESASS